MPKLTQAEIDDFLDERDHLVRIATVDAGGMPRVVPTWFIRQDRDVLFTPRGGSVFLANIRRDPRIGISIDEEPLPYRKVTVQAEARIVHDVGNDDEWRDLYRAIACRYIPTAAAEAYIEGTIDQPRALIAVSLDPAAGSKVLTWRMPVGTEDPTGIWARRYYGDGTIMATLADQSQPS